MKGLKAHMNQPNYMLHTILTFSNQSSLLPRNSKSIHLSAVSVAIHRGQPRITFNFLFLVSYSFNGFAKLGLNKFVVSCTCIYTFAHAIKNGPSVHPMITSM
ncbi:uncharacterized protein ZBAI_09859 [Zygosaccharomyces bailii ISA1307]|nr:uncharacterized protein ZBAI_09859 [Zygosaccharomyces bailii ISA1307]